MFSRVIVAACLLGVALGDTQATVAKPEVASAKNEAQTEKAAEKTETTKTQDTKANDDDADMKALLDKLNDEDTQQEFANKLISKMMLKLTGETTVDTKEANETTATDADDADMKALVDKLSDDSVQQEFAEKLVKKLSDKLFSTETMQEPETKDTQAAQEHSDADDADMKELLDKLGSDEGTQQEFAEKLVQRLTDKLSAILPQEPEPDHSDDELKEEELKELLDKLETDEDTQKEFANKLVSRLTERLFDTSLFSGLDSSAFQPLDLFNYDGEDTDDDRVLSDEDARQLADEFARHYGAKRSLSEDDEQDDEEQDDEQNAADEELIAQPVDNSGDWFALCTPGILAGASLFGVAMAFVVTFVMNFVERKRRSMELPTTLLG